jgi:hypothetical protein
MSFESYLDSIGAKQQQVYGTSTQNSNYEGYHYSDFRPIQYSFGATPQTRDPGLHHQRYRGVNPGKPYSAYVDSSGGFLGYGGKDSLQNTPGIGVAYADYMANDQDRIAQQKRDSLANAQAQLDMAQQRAAMRAAAVNSPQFTGSGLVGMGQQGMAPQQMAPQQFGRAAVPGMGRGTGQGIGRGTGQGLLGGLHRGAAPTGGTING